MKDSNEQSLGEVIRELLDHCNLTEKLTERRVLASWEDLVGTLIAKHTTRLELNNGVLWIGLDSPALATELSYAREKIAQIMNQEAGHTIVNEVRFFSS
ncbi:MAG: DUF721 domain-containing protein [Bacteroidales bacterium]|nr:DUF721 domain-containing protein [Bacteroidales bacterium]